MGKKRVLMVCFLATFACFIVMAAPSKVTILKLVLTSPMITSDLDQEFEQLSGTKIEAESTAWPDLAPKYTTTFASKSDAFDIAMIDESFTSIFGKAGWYVPLDDLLSAQDRTKAIGAYIDLYTWQGHLVAMPYMAMPYMLFYNSKILSDAGLKPATTWDEMAKQSMQLKKAGVIDYGITWPLLSGDDMSSETWGVVLMSMGGKLFDDKGQPAFDSPAGLKALQFVIASLYKDKWANPASVEVEKQEALKSFMTGKDLYNVNWDFLYPMTIDSQQSSIADYSKLAPIPTSGNPRYSSWISGAGLVVNPYISADRQKIARDYIKFIIRPDHALSLLKTKGWLSMWKEMYTNPEAIKINPYLLTLQAQLQKSAARPNAPWYREFNEILRLGLAPAFGGKMSAQEALDSVQAKVLERMKVNWQ